MPHHKSAEKRLRQTEKRTVINRARLSRVRTFVKKVETAIEPHFQEFFVAAMAIPNKVDPFPNLGKAVSLPKQSAGAVERGRRRRRGEGAVATPEVEPPVKLSPPPPRRTY